MKCPVCGKPNDCELDPQKNAADCWCFHTQIPRALLDRIPLEERNKSCICKNCVHQAQLNGEE